MGETRFDSGSVLRDPARLFAEMARDLRASRTLAWRLFLRDFHVGALITPLFSFGLLLVINRARVSPRQLVATTLVFQTFADSLLAPLRTAESCRSFISKIRFPYESLVLAGAIHCAMLLLIRFALLVFVLSNPFGVLFSALLAGLLGTAIGVLLAPLGLLFREIQYAITLLLAGVLVLMPIAIPPALGLVAVAGLLVAWLLMRISLPYVLERIGA